MTHAIAVLENAAEIAENNAPIHKAAGDQEQEDLCYKTMRDCRNLIALAESWQRATTGRVVEYVGTTGETK